jgi:hypothetical protein
MHQFTFKQAEKSPNCVTMDTVMKNIGTCLEFLHVVLLDAFEFQANPIESESSQGFLK